MLPVSGDAARHGAATFSLSQYLRLPWLYLIWHLIDNGITLAWTMMWNRMVLMMRSWPYLKVVSIPIDIIRIAPKDEGFVVGCQQHRFQRVKVGDSPSELDVLQNCIARYSIQLRSFSVCVWLHTEDFQGGPCEELKCASAAFTNDSHQNLGFSLAIVTLVYEKQLDFF